MISPFVLSACDKKLPLTTTSSPTPTTTQVNADTKASFLIFTEGTEREFTTKKYHNVSPDVYIEASNPNHVVVKKPNTTWGEFFATLPMYVDYGCLVTGTGQNFCESTTKSLKFYVNEEKVDNFLQREIRNGDNALISFGPINDPAIEGQLKQILKLKLR
ncbi:MAG: hypothetical protein NUV69_01475 [Candidatus Curtissbacteria bacterium]|nr:hypothetical protein [Candidatus Curtissbacteria bacterium]